MGNMSYCRMQNTLLDLKEVKNCWDETKSEDELNARTRILSLCRDIIDSFDEEYTVIHNDELD